MTMNFLVRLFSCIFLFYFFLYTFVEKQNQLTELRVQIPALKREVRTIEEKITKLKYEIEKFESPAHLIELAQKPEFSHLKHPLLESIIFLKKAPPLTFSNKSSSVVELQSEEVIPIR